MINKQLLLFFSIIVFMMLSVQSCTFYYPYGDHRNSGHMMYSQGFFYNNHFYDPRFYSFRPQGNRVIIIDNRTNRRIANIPQNQIQTNQNREVRDTRNNTRQSTRSAVPENRQRRGNNQQVNPRQNVRSNPANRGRSQNRNTQQNRQQNSSQASPQRSNQRQNVNRSGGSRQQNQRSQPSRPTRNRGGN
ncbi:MAG: hypothetical protein LAT68_11965 [Cyclobacteriaceae bacterium]|nr:hypothetical protein [Cyclobacteriaceae bacterium]MCH8517032.1 hypothetical protein [Cyclobacteriaceae bacterium]